MSTTPYELASWRLTPGRTAVVVIDMQNDFLSPDGWYAKSGVDISHMQAAIDPTRALVATAHQAGAPVIWTRHGFRNGVDAGVFAGLRPFLKDGGLRENTWGYEIFPDMGVLAEDRIVDKNRLSGFYGTNLDLLLRGLNADTVLIAGVLTNQCVKATAVDANFRDYRPIVVKEATGTTLPHLHDPALEMIAVGIGEVRSLDDTISELRRINDGANAG